MLKLAQYMRPKCHALLLDGSINCDTTVRLNIYQVWETRRGREQPHDSRFGTWGIACAAACASTSTKCRTQGGGRCGFKIQKGTGFCT